MADAALMREGQRSQKIEDQRKPEDFCGNRNPEKIGGQVPGPVVLCCIDFKIALSLRVSAPESAKQRVFIQSFCARTKRLAVGDITRHGNRITCVCSAGPISVLAQKWGKEALVSRLLFPSVKGKRETRSTALPATDLATLPPINTRAAHYL